MKFDGKHERLSQHELKDQELFNTISPKYLEKDLAIQSAEARKHRLLASLRDVEFTAETRVLEVGCGAGFSVKYLDRPYAEFTGVDYSKGLIDYANQYNSSDRANFICANIKEFKTHAQYDVIFMIGVLHHFDDMQGIMNLIVKLLKPGGVLVANEPQGSNWVIQGMRKMRTRIDSGYSDDQVQLVATDFEQIFRSSGLIDVKTYGQGYFSTPFAEVILNPRWLIKPIVNLAVGFDQFFLKSSKGITKRLGWNLVGIGSKPLREVAK
jgi:SAM-dependent methyltransferase